jgi:ACS family hexuronate transporter-like MFS transporter
MRWWILALLFVVTIVNFVDRQTLSIVAPILRDDLHLSNTDYGTILSAFQLGMAVGELPMGWLMDRRGARFGLAFAVLSWSLANALHVVAATALQFGLFRFWLGSGECGNYSGGNKIVAQWFPTRERALAIGIFNSASMLGSLIAMVSIPFITLRYGWKTAFVVPSALGAFWVIAWLTVYRKPTRDESDDRTTESLPPLRALLARRDTWALMGCRFLVGPVVQLYLYWTPEYLYRTHGLSLRAIGAFAWIPFLFGDLGSIGGGLVAGRLIARGVPVARTRRLTLLAGAGCCLASAVVAGAHTAGIAIAAICLVLLGHTFLSANMFASISDVFPSGAVARVTGLTGVAGSVSGMIFPWVTGVIVDRASYTPVFWLASLMPLAGVLALLGGVRFEPRWERSVAG